MILYEVNARVNVSVSDDYASWLNGHIRQILAISGFTGADWWREFPETDGCVNFVIHYRLKDDAALDSYLENHAPALRAEAKTLFGEKFSATRRTLKLIQSYPGEK